ncbi:MAG: hypothetical protein ABFD24_04095 [Anaerolineaceae bacterium]
MILIKIGEEERVLAEASEQWINQQINRRRADGISVCIIVTINERDLNLVLSTPSCNNFGGGGRPPTPKENKVYELWDQRGLSKPDFTGGNLVSFLHQFENLF